MVSDDMTLNTSALLMLFFLAAWGTCFFVFVYKKYGGPKAGRDAFLYFNFMFFKKDILSNTALTFLVLSYISAAFLGYRREFDDLKLFADLSGGISFLLFSIYGKYFFHDYIEYEKPFFFVRVFLTKLDLNSGSVFLWSSRISYLTWLVVFIIKH